MLATDTTFWTMMATMVTYMYLASMILMVVLNKLKPDEFTRSDSLKTFLLMPLGLMVIAVTEMVNIVVCLISNRSLMESAFNDPVKKKDNRDQ